MTLHEQYEYRCFGLAHARSVWSQQMFLDFCSMLNVDPNDVESIRTTGYTIPQLERMRVIPKPRIMEEA